MTQDTTSASEINYQIPIDQSKKWVWLRRVLASKNLSASGKNLAMALMMFHNETSGQCNPKQNTIAAGLGIGRSYVNKLVSELEDAGWIAVKRTRSASLYRLEIDHVEAAVEPIEMSANDNIRCPQQTTSDVANCGHLDVANCSHRTTQGNLKGEKRKEPHQPNTASERQGSALSEAAAAANRAVPEVEDGRPEFETINGVRIPTQQIEDWKREFRLIQVSVEVRRLTSWLTKEKVPEGRHLSIIADKLADKEAAKELEDRKMRYRAEADAKHNAKRTIPRPAI